MRLFQDPSVSILLHVHLRPPNKSEKVLPPQRDRDIPWIELSRSGWTAGDACIPANPGGRPPIIPVSRGHADATENTWPEGCRKRKKDQTRPALARGWSARPSVVAPPEPHPSSAPCTSTLLSCSSRRSMPGFDFPRRFLGVRTGKVFPVRAGVFQEASLCVARLRTTICGMRSRQPGPSPSSMVPEELDGVSRVTVGSPGLGTAWTIMIALSSCYGARGHPPAVHPRRSRALDVRIRV
ncbi:hypothetical protein N7492_001331 [Penicillium capsulatum]|uniref:Uncharacterized protein n=1 Tax=Penicillium capsulatum TaxID=69766 RepID=A0A9W9LZT2_9EURO|nr:hypothetical protein N7492_001331 [Penicillium capsulatum]KAJ6129610.1 hypothetical protein N7512_002390 [Penicillium capsulatum]